MKKQEFNIQDYLTSKNDRRLFLLECFKQDIGDGSLITAALKDVVEAAGKAEIAAATGIAQGTLTRQLSKGETLPFTTVAAVAKVIGVKIKAKKAKVKKVKKAKKAEEAAPAAAPAQAEAPAEAPAPEKPAKPAKAAKAKK